MKFINVHHHFIVTYHCYKLCIRNKISHIHKFYAISIANISHNKISDIVTDAADDDNNLSNIHIVC